MSLFGTDSIISVRPDNAIFFQHHGDGLHPILNREKFTKLEREVLFKQAGGITAVRKIFFDKSKPEGDKGRCSDNLNASFIQKESSF